MSNRRRKHLTAGRRLRTSQAKAGRRLRRLGSRGTAAAVAASLGWSLAGAVAPAEAAEGSPHLVADLVPGSQSGSPQSLVTVGDRVFFAAGVSDGTTGLWQTDGTTTGTTLLKSFAVEAGYEEYSYLEQLTASGGLLYFTVDDGESGTELWRSDGSTDGTRLVADVAPGAADSRPRNLVDVDGMLYFTADDGMHGRELWVTDGTAAGTRLVKDIANQSSGGDYDYDYGYPRDLTALGDQLYFTADDGVHGRELWTSDGTRAGTVMVVDLTPPDDGGYYGPAGPRRLVASGDVLFFEADDGTHGRELWKSDGTAAGTAMVKDIMQGDYARIRNLTDVAGEVFFSTSTESDQVQLWASDGTSDGTVMIKAFDQNEEGYAYLEQFTPFGDRLVFSADDGENGNELWLSDGTPAGTRMVKDAAPGYLSGSPYGMTVLGGRVYYSGRDGVHGPELWSSDGTAAGTTLVQDVRPGGRGSSPRDLTVLGDSLLFAANDGSHGYELWGYTPPAAIAPDNQFQLSKAKANPRKGWVTVRATLPGRGVLKHRAVAGSPVRKGATTVDAAGTVKVRVKLTKKGLRTLQRRGTLRVRVRFVYTPADGVAGHKTKRYVFRYVR